MYFMWDMHSRTTPEQAEVNRGRANNGTLPQVEDTTPSNDDDDDAYVVARSGMVYDPARPHQRPSWSS